MYKVINPSGEIKIMTDGEFLSFKTQVAKSQSFGSWTNINGLLGTFLHQEKDRINYPVVDKFLEIRGYKIEQTADN